MEMAKIILKTLLGGVVAWLILIVLLFFGIGFYQGLSGPNTELSAITETVLNYLVLILSLGIAALIFLFEKRKQKSVENIVAEKPRMEKESAPATPKNEARPEFYGVVMPKVKEETTQFLPPHPPISGPNMSQPPASSQKQEQPPWKRI